MRGMFLFATIIGFVAFVFGAIGSLFARQATLFERFMIAVMCAAVAFVAAVLLFSRDHLRYTMARRRVQRMLLARHDVNDRDFAACFPAADPTLVTEVRRAMAGFFGVPAEKIHPADDLPEDLKVPELEPGFHTTVFFHIFAKWSVAPQSFRYNSRSVVNIGDLVREIGRVLAEFESARDTDAR